TVRLALDHGVALGAHPGYPDLLGFGRRSLALSPAEAEAYVLYQVAALAGIAQAHGARLTHVKPHGQLYNDAVANPALAAAIARAVARLDDRLILVGLAGSALVQAGRDAGLTVAEEVFADRVYEADGRLRSRRLPDAMLHDPARSAEQALRMVRDGQVVAYDGTVVPVRADTVCIHGDGPTAPAIARELRARLEAAGVAVRRLSRQ
ncbi:MAG: LamB/YcsF family protein, partial [Anaerolineae bacterium]|nr:LamB/YcsF family protein [Anaerolineae bacterium]